MGIGAAIDSDRFISRLEVLFSLSPHEITEMIRHLHDEMRRGLSGESSSLKMIPSFVVRPKGTEKGKFLALDLGGTNIRVLAVALRGNGDVRLEGISRFVIPHEVMTGVGDGLFDFMAECILAFFKENPADRQDAYDLAFTFSFPVEQHAIDAGTLICWTKGFTASDVVGREVVTLLADALKRKQMGFIRVTALVNDTVGTLMTKCYADPACDMGVILGTGTNACYPEKISRIPGYKGAPESAEMIVNMEWGGFDRLRTNMYDQALDRASHNTGRQRLEKMVSGMYLGEIARLIIADMHGKGLLLTDKYPAAFSEVHTLTAEHLSMAARGEDIFTDFGLADISAKDRKRILNIFRIVSGRSAGIAGAAIAAVVSWMDPEIETDHVVAVDGALYEKYPGYQDRIVHMLHQILSARADRIKLETAKDGSGIGAAVIAAVAASGRR